MTRTSIDRRKIESAGVDSVRKMFGSGAWFSAAPKQRLAARRNPATSTAKAANFLAVPGTLVSTFTCASLDPVTHPSAFCSVFRRRSPACSHRSGVCIRRCPPGFRLVMIQPAHGEAKNAAFESRHPLPEFGNIHRPPSTLHERGIAGL